MAPIRTLFYCKPETGMNMTEMMTYQWSLVNYEGRPISFEKVIINFSKYDKSEIYIL